MKACDGKEERIPLRLLNYAISSIHYGGKITSARDESVAQELLATLVHEQTITRTPFNLSGEAEPSERLSKYMMPSPGSLEHYADHLQRLPAHDCPGVLGIHEQAQGAMVEAEGDSVLKRAFDFTFRPSLRADLTPSSIFDVQSVGQFKRYKTKVSDVEAKIPELLPTSQLETHFVASYKDSIAIMMNREVSAYNTLIRLLRAQASLLQQSLDGATVFDQDMEEVLHCVLVDKTPPSWLKNSYPSSQSLLVYLSNLQERVDYIREILEKKDPRKGLRTFWLPGLFDQANFFTTLLQ